MAKSKKKTDTASQQNQRWYKCDKCGKNIMVESSPDGPYPNFAVTRCLKCIDKYGQEVSERKDPFNVQSVDVTHGLTANANEEDSKEADPTKPVQSVEETPGDTTSVPTTVPASTIKVTVGNLTPEDAEKLYWAVHSGELDHLGVTGAEYVEGEKRSDPTLPTSVDGAED